MKLLPLFLLLAGCLDVQAQRDLIRELSLDECEIGTVQISGQLSTTNNPFVAGGLTVSLYEERTLDQLPYDCLDNARKAREGVTDE